MYWLYILGIFVCIFIYIIGILVCTNAETTEDVRKDFLWPILLILFFVKTPIWLINDSLSTLLLIFNYDYKKTNLYKFINTKFD